LSAQKRKHELDTSNAVKDALAAQKTKLFAEVYSEAASAVELKFRKELELAAAKAEAAEAALVVAKQVCDRWTKKRKDCKEGATTQERVVGVTRW
jgi:hypothetical protein